MRAALISLPQPGEGEQPRIAGKSLAERQLLFALQCGCDAVIAHGGGASADAIALRHAVEKAGLRYQVISSSHALPGALDAGDSLLVLQPGMLPESRQALDLLRAEGDRMLVVSAGPGTAAGFERIDLDRAWAGALTLPGAWLDRLASLPEDAAPHAALLRIALQQRLPEARLNDATLDDGRWMVIGNEDAAAKRESSWLRSQLGISPIGAFSRWIGRHFIARAGTWLMDRRFSRAVILAFAALLLGGGVAAAWYDQPAIAFALAALSAPVIEAFLALSRLAVAPFGRIGALTWLRSSVDAALLAIGILAIDSLWYRAAFPPLVLVAGLLLLDRGAVHRLLEPVRDRGLVAAGIAVLAAVVAPEVAIILAATLIIAAKLLPEANDES